jgi:hypothetical protein
MSSPLYSGPKRREEKRSTPIKGKKRCIISSPTLLASHGLPKQKKIKK